MAEQVRKLVLAVGTYSRQVYRHVLLGLAFHPRGTLSIIFSRLFILLQASAGKYQIQTEKAQSQLDKTQSEFDRMQEKFERSQNEIRKVSDNIAIPLRSNT